MVPISENGAAASAASSLVNPASGRTASSVVLSIIIPVYNEQGNILLLRDKLDEALRALDVDHEIIFVDDGSTDSTETLLTSIAASDSRYKVIVFRRNFGQTAAMMAGIDFASGDIIVPLDGDLQNDPGDIPRLLAKLEEGYDVVSGWRLKRQDNALTRTIPSRLANWLISRISGVHLHDYGCSLKAYRRHVIKDVRLYGEMHRFIPIYASWQGGRIAELPVNHFLRRDGRSKYGLDRIVKVVLDLIVVKFLASYSHKPIYIFGGFGLFSIAISFIAGLLALYLKYFKGTSFIATPLPLLVVLAFITGVMSVLMGLIAEMIMRTYYESQSKRIYLVKRVLNLEPT